MDSLQRHDIVGRSIVNIYESPWDVDADGFGSCSTYVKLEGGVAFELQSQDIGSFPIIAVVLDNTECQISEEPYLRERVGKVVVEVLSSEYWPGLGLLLSDNYFLYQRDFPNTSRSGALLIAGYSDRVGDTYQLSDTIPYWRCEQ